MLPSINSLINDSPGLQKDKAQGSREANKQLSGTDSAMQRTRPPALQATQHHLQSQIYQSNALQMQYNTGLLKGAPFSHGSQAPYPSNYPQSSNYQQQPQSHQLTHIPQHSRNLSGTSYPGSYPQPFQTPMPQSYSTTTTSSVHQQSIQRLQGPDYRPPHQPYYGQAYESDYQAANKPLYDDVGISSSHWYDQNDEISNNDIGANATKYETPETKEKRLQKEKEKRDQITDGITRLQKLVPKLNPEKAAAIAAASARGSTSLKEKSKKKQQSEKRLKNSTKGSSSDLPKRTSKATILQSSAQYIKDLKKEIADLQAKLKEYNKLDHLAKKAEKRNTEKDIQEYKNKLNEFERYKKDLTSSSSAYRPLKRPVEDMLPTKPVSEIKLPSLKEITLPFPSSHSSSISSFHSGYTLPPLSTSLGSLQLPTLHQQNTQLPPLPPSHLPSQKPQKFIQHQHPLQVGDTLPSQENYGYSYNTSPTHSASYAPNSANATPNPLQQQFSQQLSRGPLSGSLDASVMPPSSSAYQPYGSYSSDSTKSKDKSSSSTSLSKYKI